ncbi:Fibrocystin-L [Tetrabaena socialis]|uniref:Fibrocystin-L n=1 Tax=Tetrabaena socialis TaxID=47790 RepID=A0A2J8A3J5_9CHLO|nr:Fibrocystin-L [Tetrabaena socialis]|eukprot:PNH07097.1 Fibrocystin-L [Tetrabaena socialis]
MGAEGPCSCELQARARARASIAEFGVTNSSLAYLNYTASVYTQGVPPPPPSPPPPALACTPANPRTLLEVGEAAPEVRRSLIPDLTGWQVAAFNVTVPAVTPGGRWLLSALGSDATPQLLAWNAPASTVEGAFRGMVNNRQASVSLASSVIEGGYYSNIWTVTHSINDGNNFPTFTAVSYTDVPAGAAVFFNLTQEASSPVDGTFRIAYGTFCESVAIALTDSADDVELKLSSLPGMFAPIEVVKYGNKNNGFSFKVTFDPLANPGNQPLLRIIDASNITGTDLRAFVVENVVGSTRQFFAPLPTEFTALPVAAPVELSVRVNGVPSSCAMPGGICTFAYSANLTGNLTAIDPASLVFGPNDASLSLTLTGLGFNSTLAGNEVIVDDGTPCPVVSASATRLVCALPNTVAAGTRSVGVRVWGRGFASWRGAYNASATFTARTLAVNATTMGAAVSSTGTTLFNITGRGFDGAACDRNRVSVGPTWCGVMACSPSLLQVLCARPNDGAATPAPGSVLVSVLSPTNSTIDTYSAGDVSMDPAAPAAAVTSALALAGAGAPITLSTTGMAGWALRAAWLMPSLAALSFASSSQSAALSASRAAALECGGLSYDGIATANCTLPSITTGSYQLALQPQPDPATGAARPWVLAQQVLTFDMALTAVSPAAGSVGGGTELVISGTGFATGAAAGKNVVFITVPVSTTWLNGLIPCDVTSATATQLRCRTRAHLAADADASDPFAKLVMPRSTPSAAVQVVVCGDDMSTSPDVLRFYCFFQPRAARASCRGLGGCDYAYSWDLTPSVSGVSPALAYPGDVLNVTGQALSGVASLELRSADGALVEVCTNMVAPPNASLVSCQLSANVPSGVFAVALVTGASGGGRSVDPAKSGLVVVRTLLLAVTNGVGSMGGSGVVTITATGAAFNTTNLAKNKVSIDTLSCAVINATSTTLTCGLPPIAGNVRAEFWNVTTGPVMGDVFNFVNPLFVTYYPAVSNQRFTAPTWLMWSSSGGPDPSIATDYFAGRFTFHMQINTTGAYAFQFTVDDHCMLYIDGVYAGSRDDRPIRTSLSAGVHRFVVTYLEYAGISHIDMLWDAGDGLGATRRLPWSGAMPFPFSTAIPISVTVNDIPAGTACTSETLDLAAGAAATDGDPTSLTTPGGLCPYVFSPYRTPLITAASGLPAGRLPATLTLSGRFLTTVASRVKVTIGGESCTGVTLLPAGALGSNLFCQAPSLPGNVLRPILVEVEGLGFARAAPTIDLTALSVRFPIGSTGVDPPRASWGGGFDYTLTGFGFVPQSGPMRAMGRTQGVQFTDGQIFPGNVSLLALTQYVISATSNQIVVRFPRIFSDTPATWDVWKTVFVYLCDTNAPDCTNWGGAGGSLVFDDNLTPQATPVRPAVVPVSASLSYNISVDWRIESYVNLNISYPGNASRVSVSLTPTPTIKPSVLNYSQPFPTCTAPTVVTAFRASNLRTYNETLTCSLPPGTPANTYTVWLCFPNTGCENAPGTVTVPLSISDVTPRTGSVAGGINVTITGAGFASNASFVSVWFGPAPCTVLSASFTSVTCALGSALNASSPILPSTATIASLTVSPSEGAPNQTFALTATSFTFDPVATPVVNSASLSRGSTEGGTNLAFSVSGFDGVLTTDITITLGTIPCTNVALSANAATLTCTTPKPPGPKPLGPSPVLVAVAGRGLAASTATYEYVDLWSRQTTWGGGPPPVEGSLAYIPANTTVLLDINTPTLGLLVVEGTLLFDDTVPDIELRAKYILVRGGGTLSVGTEAVPYAGRARITIVGLPHVDPELPLYGAKVLAVRDGTVILHGQHKEPSWTRLAATADVNATAITLAATVNWQAGDTIAIASSSFYTDEAETATIVSVVNSDAGDACTIVLDRRLNFTHLGVVEQLAGGRAGSIDMRAEVAVLSRNVVFQGDADSERFLFGATILVNTPAGKPRANLRFNNAEVRQTGQAFRLGRYSIHFHMHGDLAYASYLRGCAIHHTYNRALTIHGSHRVLVQNNTAYRTMGHTFFLEDGIETGNLFDGNLGMSTKASSVGLVVFANITSADNGAGPKQHIVNGKDNGGSIEFSWIVDDRSRATTNLTSMAGLRNAVLVSRTVAGQLGTAGQWPSGRKIAAFIGQSPPLGNSKHSALLSLINVTFVDWTGNQFFALEACGKCKTFQGGATTFMAGLSFVQSNTTLFPFPALSSWSYGHQGVFLDTDGTLVNRANLPTTIPLPWVPGTAGATWHSAVDSQLFDPAECTYVRGMYTANDGAVCSPSLIFRRVMLNGHLPMSLQPRMLLVTSVATNRTSNVFFTHYNEDGYQFTLATRRDYHFSWDNIVRIDPDEYRMACGNLTFMPGLDLTLSARYIFVLVTGNFYVGSAASPFTNGSARIRLAGGRDSPSRAVDSSLVLGSKFLAVFRGGTLDLHGRPVGRRWTRLGASALPGATNITLATAQPGWPVGANVLITSSSYNVWQTEERTIVGVLNATNNGTMLLLDSPLTHPHYSWVKAFTGSSPTAASAVDMRAEVALLSSNVVVESAEGPGVDAFGGEYFGCRIVASGPTAARMSNVAVRYCGQSGMERPAVLFDRLSPLSGGAANPSFLRESVIYRSVEGALALRGYNTSSPVNITTNVMYYSYDKDTVGVATQRNYIIDNLVLGTVKNMVGNSGFDPRLPASFLIEHPFNFIEGNVAAGSERLGFWYSGLPCSTLSANRSTAPGSFLNNTAHSTLAGMRLLSSPPSEDEGCTGVANFTSYMAWDFDIISPHGIETDVLLRNINVLNSKHAGILILKVGEMTQAARVDLVDSIVAGRTHPEVCGLCASNEGVGDPGCHPKLSVQSFNKVPPFSPSVGLVSSTFAIEFTKGPEQKPWDGLKGYQTILGVMYINRTTFAGFQGPAACGGSQGAYAIGNHPKAPDAFHPHYFNGSNVVNVLNNATASGLFYFEGPDPGWRNEADCGLQTFNRSDGSMMMLNCAGPKHIHFRDLDGRLTGQVNTIVGFNDRPRTFPYDQGTPLIPGPCALLPSTPAYTCAPNSSAYLLPSTALKPVPTPVGGISGNQHMFVLESRDSDSEDRNFGPVAFNVSGSIDLVVAAMDQGWCFGYTCQKRLSTFWTYLPMGHTVGVNFTGTPASTFRLWLPYAAPEDELVLEIYYLMIPNRRFVWLPDGTGRQSPSPTKPRPGDGRPHGAYYWDQRTTTITLKIKGGRSLEVRGENAVMVGWGLSMSINDFYDSQQLFIANLAAFLGIPPERIFIANVVAGTSRRRSRALLQGSAGDAQVDVMIYDDPAASNNEALPEPVIDTSNNVDSESARPFLSATDRQCKST